MMLHAEAWTDILYYHIFVQWGVFSYKAKPKPRQLCLLKKGLKQMATAKEALERKTFWDIV